MKFFKEKERKKQVKMQRHKRTNEERKRGLSYNKGCQKSLPLSCLFSTNCHFYFEQYTNKARSGTMRPKGLLQQKTFSFNPPASEASREVTNLTWRKNPHATVYGVKEFVCLSVTNFELNYLRTGEIESAQKFFWISLSKSVFPQKNSRCRAGMA